MKRKMWFYYLMLTGLLFIMTTSCKKDDTSNNDNNNKPPEDTTTVKDIDGNVYHIIKIGTQRWMLENLKTTKYRDGTSIPNVTDGVAWEDLTTGAYCDYNNVATNSNTYGRLYNWYSITNSHQLCPAGWHVPSDADWNLLVNYLGGDSVAGGKMKETGLTHWCTPNTGATNSSGFTALPAGMRTCPDGPFSNLQGRCTFWSSTQDVIGYAWTRYIFSFQKGLTRNNYAMSHGYSIRCIKD